MVDQALLAGGLPGVERLLQRIKHEVRGHAPADAPADDTAGEHIHDEGDIQPALPSRDIGEIRHPKLIGAIGLELPIDQVQRARR